MSQIETTSDSTPATDSTRRSTAPGDDSRVPWPLVSTATLAVVVMVWWILTDLTGTIPPLYFPTISQVVASASTLGGTIVADGLATLVRVLVSWVLGSILGIVVGLAMARSKWVYFIVSPLVEALRPVPPVALIPFVILWFGIGDSGKIFLGAIGCFMVMVVNTFVSAGNVPPVYLRAARSLGASERRVYRSVILPAIVPELISGLRIGAALAFAIVVAAELLGAPSGIGRLIMQASRTLNTPVVLLGTIVIGLEAFAVERAIRAVSARVTSWTDTDS